MNQEKSTKEPLSFAIVRVFSLTTNVQIAQKIADKLYDDSLDSRTLGPIPKSLINFKYVRKFWPIC